nr:retrovirus-related Pol polyprotein from transposon TNT 1-94 [Tanacetum cinerariifolium]
MVTTLSSISFGAINHLARHGLLRGLPRIKLEKGHLCSACAMGKSKKQSHIHKVMVITLKWIYKVKLDELGGILKNKARLVARGYHQEERIDFEESFAPLALPLQFLYKKLLLLLSQPVYLPQQQLIKMHLL